VAHALHAAGDHDVGVAKLDGLGSQVNRFQAGTANLVDGEGRHFDGNVRLHRRLTGGVLAETGLQDVAHDDFVHLSRFDSGSFQGCLDGDGSQPGGGNVFQSAVEGSDGRAHRADDNGFSAHGKHHLREKV